MILVTVRTLVSSWPESSFTLIKLYHPCIFNVLSEVREYGLNW